MKKVCDICGFVIQNYMSTICPNCGNQLVNYGLTDNQSFPRLGKNTRRN